MTLPAPMLEALIGQLDALGEQAKALEPLVAGRSEVAEDVTLMRQQIERARKTANALGADGTAPLEVSTGLHGMNNALTGVISLALLCAEDAPAADPLRDALRELERNARACTDLLRALSRLPGHSA